VIDEHAVLELLTEAVRWYESHDRRYVTARLYPAWVRQAREMIERHYRDDPHRPLDAGDNPEYKPEP
jgi:hypothetical protein